MSTRATYEVKKSLGYSAMFYIHHDGYPEGAAYYFLKALLHKTADRAPNESFAERFLRGNDRAEITVSHDRHGDTDYQYTYDEKTEKLTATKMNRNWHDDTESPVVIFSGSLEEFINKYGAKFCGELFDGGVFEPLAIL